MGAVTAAGAPCTWSRMRRRCSRRRRRNGTGHRAFAPLAARASLGGGGGAGLHAVLQVTVHPDFFGFAMAVLLLAFVAQPLQDFGANVSMMRAMGVFAALFAMGACSTATTETRSPDASMSGADTASPSGEAEG